MKLDYNPYLARETSVDDQRDLAQQRIETPGERENVVWQTRAAPPTEYENALADALVSIFEQGVEDLDTLIVKLNEIGLQSPEGRNWSADIFERVMSELGR